LKEVIEEESEMKPVSSDDMNLLTTLHIEKEEEAKGSMPTYAYDDLYADKIKPKQSLIDPKQW
jgi:hypothetical protein